MRKRRGLSRPRNDKFRRGDVVLVPFPYADLTTTKQRPAVVVSGSTYHQTEPDIILVAITGQIPQHLAPTDYRLQDWQQAGLFAIADEGVLGDGRTNFGAISFGTSDGARPSSSVRSRRLVVALISVGISTLASLKTVPKAGSALRISLIHCLTSAV